MNLNELRNDLSLKCKNGLPFLCSATVVWSIMLVIFLLPLDIRNKNILTFCCTGIMFPLSVLFAKITKTDWNAATNPLSKLGLYLNIAQFVYFPIIFWAFAKTPNEMIMFFAIITGAHLFPYGWLYNTKAYMIMAPIISIIITIINWNISISNLWCIPLSTLLLIIILNIWIYLDYKQKISVKLSTSA